MGCINSKQRVSVTPALDHSGEFQDNGSKILASPVRNRAGKSPDLENKEKVSVKCELTRSKSKLLPRSKSNNGDSLNLRLGNLQKHLEGEQVAAGWPVWLSAVAGEAIQGWIPLRADSFEKLEKIGQGTYSSVFRARDISNGKIVALKRVRFDKFEPESVRFMAREIMILRRLDHPNIVKLEGVITSRLSCRIYLVFEYMEHDLGRLSSSHDIRFNEAQVKCYMHQLLSGIEHCHSRGIMHRDIKGSNLLVNNKGILKVADFGLANFFNSRYKQPLTSKVVTLWYRPPELLLGSTNYDATMDLWSVGCVFAELFLKKPILQGRSEVEQLHKIFKLCGSPSEEYWEKLKLPYATIFKPQHPYKSNLRETCKDVPATALGLIEKFLSVEPYKRGDAQSALASEYFSTKPYACDPSTLPKYPSNKEVGDRIRHDARRMRDTTREKGRPETTRRPVKTCKGSQEQNGQSKPGPPPKDCRVNTLHTHKADGANANFPKVDVNANVSGKSHMPLIKHDATVQVHTHKADGANANLPKVDVNANVFGESHELLIKHDATVQVHTHKADGANANLPKVDVHANVIGESHMPLIKHDATVQEGKRHPADTRANYRYRSRGQVSNSLDPSCSLKKKKFPYSKGQENGNILFETKVNSKLHDSYKIDNRVAAKH